MSHAAAAVLAGILLLLAGIGLGLASVVTNEWLEVTVGGITQTAGLWRVCIAGNCENQSRTDQLDASRAMMMLGVIFAGIALLSSIIDFGHLSVKKPIARSVAIFIVALAILAVACTVVGIVVYQTEVWDNIAPSGAFRGYSSWLAVGSVGSYTVACLFLLIRFCLEGRNHNDMKNVDDNQKDPAIRAYEMERERARERQEERVLELERERALEEHRRSLSHSKPNPYGAFPERRHSSRKERGGGREYRDFPAYAAPPSGAYARYVPMEYPVNYSTGWSDPRIHGPPLIYDDGYRAQHPRQSTRSLPIQNIMYGNYRYPLY